MIFLDVKRVTEVHDLIIRETGGELGVLFEGNLDFCIQRHKIYLYGYEVFPDLFQKAAALMHCIIVFHPFVDGNKRTGFVVSSIFLENNNYSLNVERSEVISFTIRIAEGNIEILEIAQWLLEHSTFIPSE
jgi:death-on-curing protein